MPDSPNTQDSQHARDSQRADYLRQEPKKSRVVPDSELIRKCLSSECSGCRENCPAYIAFQLDSYSSRGKNRALEIYARGELGSMDIVDLVFTCTTCGQCAEVCLTGGSIFQQILELRHALREIDCEVPGLKEMVSYIRENNTPYGRKDTSWMIDDLRLDKQKKGRIQDMKTGKIGYFPGCSILAENPEFAVKTLSVLNTLGTRPVTISRPCCGLPVLNAGFTEDARAMALEFNQELKDRKIKTVITSCAGCTVMLRLNFSKLTGKKNHFRVVHITEYLDKRRKALGQISKETNSNIVSNSKSNVDSNNDSKIELKNESKKEIFYHDPCDLARKLGIIDEPRRVIEALGYSIREFTKNRTETSCCGGGGGFSRLYPDEAAGIAGGRINEAEEQGGRRIVTACLNCRRMLRSSAGENTEVLDIIELIKDTDCY